MTKKKMALFGVAFVLVYTIGWFMGDSSAVGRVNAMHQASPSTQSSMPAVAPVAIPESTTPAVAPYKNPMSWAVYRATRPKTDTRMALTAKLSDYYNYDYRDLVDTYWAVSFSDMSHKESADATGYIRKDTPDGKKIFDILKDGMSHNMILESKYKSNDGSNTVEITKFVKEVK